MIVLLSKIIALFASFLMLFSFAFPKQEPYTEGGVPLKEEMPAPNALRTFDEIRGADDGVFYIGRPSADALNTVYGADFGLSAEKADNYPALVAAAEYCSSHPGTRLQLAPGSYYLDNTAPVKWSGCRDILIDGCGARLIFSQVHNGMEITGCDCLEFRDIKFDWDSEKLPLSDVFTVQNASPKTNELDFVFERDDIEEDMILSAVSQCDPQSLTFGAKYSNKEVYIYMQPECVTSVRKTADNVLHIGHNGCFDNFENGDTFILRHYVYDSTFCVIGGESRNITFDGISLYGWPGSGFYGGGMASHFQILRSYIGVEPGKEDRYHASLGADAIHIVNTNGCFCIAGCDISGQGDDALNVHDGLGWVKSVDGNRITLLGNAILLRVGDTLHFRDALFNDTGVQAAITALTYHPDTVTYDLTLDKDISALIGADCIAYNTAYDSGNYVVRDNYIHENRARGFLLQSSNGLCENNRFYKTEMQAIKIIMDISPGLWYEGKGVDGLVIRNNTFDTCDYIATGEVITVGSNIAGKTAVSQPFTNVSITDNTFTEFPGRVINCNNANGLVFAGNRIDAGTLMPRSAASARAFFGRYCSNIAFRDNEWQHCLLGETAAAGSPDIWARINAAGPEC